MRVKPKLSWFTSDKGKNVVFVGTCLTGCGVFSFNFLPHSLFLEKFKDIVQMYRGGEGVAVPGKVLTRAQSVIDTMKIPENEKSLIKFFTVYGFDPFYAGSTNLNCGTYVGIPVSFGYDKASDVEKQQIIVRGEPVVWGSSSAQNLLNSLVLSEEAQKFAIATQIHQARTHHVLLHSSTAISCFLATYSFSHAANKKFNTFSKPLPIRLILYTLIGSFMAGVWALLKDVTTANLEYKADKEVAELSMDLAKGGIEFYEKILARNKALRDLMGPSGEKEFAASGNTQILLRTKHLPITQRRDNLQAFINSKLKENASQQPSG